MKSAPSQRWPERLWLVRHGQSAGNVARDAAVAALAERIVIAEREIDVPLSPLGIRQANALGDWFAELSPIQRPDVILSSPYLRAARTAQAVEERMCRNRGRVQITVDERLREKELGILDRLTRSGIETIFPEQAEARRTLGKFYHRAPGGESWCDVILRLRSVLDTISLHYAGRRVLVVSHQVVVLCFRYLLDNMNEQQILAIDRASEVSNCGVTEYTCDPDAGMRLVRYNYTAPLDEESIPVTSAPDAPAGPR